MKVLNEIQETERFLIVNPEHEDTLPIDDDATSKIKDLDKALEVFEMTLMTDFDFPIALAAIKVMRHILSESEATTLNELQHQLISVRRILINKCISPSIESGCNMFLRFISLNAEDSSCFDSCRSSLKEKAKIFYSNINKSRNLLTQMCSHIIESNMVILLHSYSATVMELLISCYKKGTKFEVYVTECSLDNSGYRVKERLEKEQINCVLIKDSAVGYIIERCDCVILGAECVTECGGIINKIGSYQIAVMAKYSHVPVFAAAESYKFLRFYPYSQDEVPNEFKYDAKIEKYINNEHHPTRDLTHSSLIDYLLTDIGIIRPEIVNDEILKLYY